MWCTTPVLFQPMCVWMNQVSHIEAAMMALAMHIVAWFSMTFSVYSGADPAALFSAELCSKTSCTSISSVQKKIYIKSINFLKGSSRTPHGWWKKMQHRKHSVSNSSAISCSRLCVAKRVYKCSAKHSLFIQWPVLGGFCKAVAAQFFCRTTSYCC